MLLRRALKFSLPWIFLCVVFWKPLLEGGMGLGVKAFLQVSHGWKFDYRSVAWGEKGLIFTDFILDDPNHFWLRAEEAVVVFSKRHLEIEKPRIVLRELPRMKGAFSWTCHFHQGNLEGEGIAPVQFEAERGRAGGHVQLDWKEGTLKGEVVEEQGAIKVDLALQEFRPEWLRRWLGNELKGTFSGKAYVVWEEGKWARGMGKLQGKEVGWKEDMRGVQGVVDWEGPFDREQFFQNGRFRVHLAGGKWLEWSEIRGEGNFVGGMGTKWEFAGVGREKFPVAWKGRGFFQNAKAHWVESDLSCGEARFILKADKKKQWAWEGKCERVGAEHAGFLQSFLALVDPIFGEVALLEGMFDLQGKGEGEQWELMAGSAEGLKGKGSDWSFAVQKGNYAPSGEFFFEGGKIEANWLQISPVWNGKGKIEGGRVCESEFEGKWEESLSL